MNIRWRASPNYTPGRTQNVTKVVLHWIVGNLATADAVFIDQNSQLSAHYAIEDDTVYQYVKESDTAWHAMNANPYTIGIEHSAAPGRPASQATINTSAQLVREICIRNNIPIDREHIIKHSQVVNTQCPGTIPIDEIINKAKGDDMEDISLEIGRILYAFVGYDGMRGKPNALAGEMDGEITRATKGQKLSGNYIRSLYQSQAFKDAQKTMGGIYAEAMARRKESDSAKLEFEPVTEQLYKPKKK